MKIASLSLALLFTVAAGLRAQPPRGYFPWWDGPQVRDINLSEDQRRQIREVVRDYRAKLIDARAVVEKAEGEVDDLFNDDQSDARRAGEAVDKLVAARGELTRAFAQMSLKLRSVLTQQQWLELRKRRAEKAPPPPPPPAPPASTPRPGQPRTQQQRYQPPQPPQAPQPPQPPAEETTSSII